MNLTSFWEPWVYLDPAYGTRLGGYYTAFDGIHLATVHGAGHEVKEERFQPCLQLCGITLGAGSCAGVVFVFEDPVPTKLIFFFFFN